MSDRKTERRGLGRGLSALMADVGLDGSSNATDSNMGAQRTSVLQIPVESIQPNPMQPRRRFDEAALADLAASIREKGIIQPIIIRVHPARANSYEIVAGERRWQAAQIAQLQSVPAIVRDFDDREVIEVAIIENIQRAELNAIEEAAGYRQLVDRFGHTQERIASALGKSRSHIANLLRLLTLPQEVQNMVIGGTLSAGHARALVTAEDPTALAAKVVGRGLSVRETEDLARKVASPNARKHRDNPKRDADTRVLEEDLSANLGMAVTIDHRAGGEGSLTIKYQRLDQLDQLCQILSSVR